MRQIAAAGSNARGQLGLGHTDDAAVPTRPETAGTHSGPAPATPLELTGGANHSLALVRGPHGAELWVCGDNTDGQLGLGEGSPPHTPVWTRCPLPTTPADPPTAAACGWTTSFVVTAAGRVLVAGSNAHGQAGLGSVRGSPSFVQLPSALDGHQPDSDSLPVLPPIRRIACGLRHTLMLAVDSSVWACGANRFGELGLAPFTKPVTIAQRIAGLPPAVDIACGQHHTLVICARSGRIAAFGKNRHGQLGAAPSAVPASADPIWTSLPGGARAATAVAGWSTSGAVSDDGALFLWGRCDRGQLGGHADAVRAADPLASAETPCAIRWSPFAVNLGCGFIELSSDGAGRPRFAIAAGSEHMLAVVAHPTGCRCVAWGWNEHGNCGVGHLADVHEPTPLVGMDPLPGGAVVAVGAGGGHSLVWV
ncbi:alpha tubulin suppressor [Polyrhizophydium stewartii]|uniref:Alpha tubulin suppressor n=1 Tax=Polyrhizophydium stewartii TaxID=2732419 RepID=A0ABR4NGT0_9FUNG